ncbi:chromate efflux transporter [Thermodesulfovibrio thiophilus]|uniref:chromate efflux transporter n=1 Tax=Thermodesulfovibrio thiophilus TaxID=340095 RepID=UPI0018069048|nr:chromate efflux transporter [Thermodesulfovibrio thiophilus]HHW20640.1 chromate efflux transporter [Thermodesulfovibrio thiophilus]
MISITEIFISFLKLGLTAFGGPAMIVYIKEMVVTKKKWLDKENFQEGVALAQAIPGATAMQVAGYVGLKTRGIIGGLASFTAFGFPAFLLMLVLSFLYSKTHSIPEVVSLFTGLQVIVVAIVANAFLSFAKPVIKSTGEIAVAILSFILFMFKLNPFLIIIACFIIAQIIFRDSTTEKEQAFKINLYGIGILLVFIFVGLFFLYFIDRNLLTLALIMMKIDFFAFGGGYASLPLMLHEFVENFKWIDEKTFMDGIALGQITPGPIVITSTFVGYILYGFSGAVVATVAIFTPSFIILASLTELSRKIRHSRVFLRGKRGLLASFSGLLLFATVKFSSAVSWDLIKLCMVLISFYALVRRVNILYIVIGGALFSLYAMH